jgi:hypothetical protein
MIFARERDCARVVKSCGLPVVKSKCPVDGTTERQEIKALLNSLEKNTAIQEKKYLAPCKEEI